MTAPRPTVQRSPKTTPRRLRPLMKQPSSRSRSRPAWMCRAWWMRTLRSQKTRPPEEPRRARSSAPRHSRRPTIQVSSSTSGALHSSSASGVAAAAARDVRAEGLDARPRACLRPRFCRLPHPGPSGACSRGSASASGAEAGDRASGRQFHRQALVGVRDGLPGVDRAGALRGRRAAAVHAFRVGEQRFERSPQPLRAFLARVAYSGVADGLHVGPVVVDHDAGAGGHGLHDHGVRAADLGRRDEDGRVAQELAVRGPELVAGEEDAVVPGRAQLCLVLLRVGGVADDHQAQVGLQPAERLDQHVRVVLRHEPADEEDVAARRQAEALGARRRARSGRRRRRTARRPAARTRRGCRRSRGRGRGTAAGWCASR